MNGSREGARMNGSRKGARMRSGKGARMKQRARVRA